VNGYAGDDGVGKEGRRAKNKTIWFRLVAKKTSSRVARYDFIHRI
jgi:hypothetical protein